MAEETNGTGTNGTNGANGFNLDDWLQNTGPLPTDIRHILNLSAIAQLPVGFQLGVTFAYSSMRPFSSTTKSTVILILWTPQTGPISFTVACVNTLVSMSFLTG